MTEHIIVPNIKNYTHKIIDGVLILTPKKIYITKNELNMTNIKHSSIIGCVIKKGSENISKNTRYQSVLIDIWKSMSTQKILQTTTYKFKLNNDNYEKGYSWCNHINMLFQSKDEKGTLNEIINMVKVNNMYINLSIQLETGRIINFKIE